MSIDPSSIRAVMQAMKDRQDRHEDAGEPHADTHGGQYRLGKADAFGDAITLLEEYTGVSQAGLVARKDTPCSSPWVKDFMQEHMARYDREAAAASAAVE